MCLHVCVYKGSLRTGNLRSDVNRQHLVSSTLPPQRLVSLQTAAASVGCFSQTKHGGRAALAETRAPAETQRRSMYRGSDWLALSHIWRTSQHLWLHPHTRSRHEERGNTLLEIFRSQLDDTDLMWAKTTKFKSNRTPGCSCTSYLLNAVWTPIRWTQEHTKLPHKSSPLWWLN